MPESSGAVTLRDLALFSSRARNLRNVCAQGGVAFVALSLVGFVEVPPWRLVIFVSYVFVPGVAMLAGAVAAGRRPFATAVAVALASAAAEAFLLFILIRADRPSRAALVFAALSAYWPLSFASWAIDLRGADRWIRRHAEAWHRVRRGASALATMAAGSAADGIAQGEGGAASAPERGTAFALRLVAAPLGAGLVAAFGVYGLVLCVPALIDDVVSILASVGLDR